MVPNLRVLFLCTGNTCRSQMAEAWTRHPKGDLFVPYSAGIEAREVDPRAVKVMAEVGIDVSGQISKHVDALGGIEFENVVTLCDHAQETCPFFPANTTLVHKGFDDPPKLAISATNEDEALDRDEIRAFVDGMPGSLELDEGDSQ